MTSKRKVFYSFHYDPDNWRASQVRNIGRVEGNKPTADNDWDKVRSRGESTIKNWIKEQMEQKKCTVVLVGSRTANRYWINYEIIESWKRGMGVVGIHIHGLQDQYGAISPLGENPFDCLDYGKYKFSQIVRCYNPPGFYSHNKYSWVAAHLSDAAEEAIHIRKQY